MHIVYVIMILGLVFYVQKEIFVKQKKHIYCQTTSNESISLFSMSELASSIVINEYSHFFFFFLFVNSQLLILKNNF